MFNLATADGYFAATDGNLDFFVPDKEFDRAAAQNTQGFDTGAVEAMKREQGLDMIVFGSASIVQQLTEAGLIDEYQLCVNPVLLGSGRSLLGSTRGAGLTLLESRTYGSGNVSSTPSATW
jgi:dihydrofolate reductase